MQTATAATSHFRRGWVYVLTLALVTINYMDRSALGIVAQSVRGEFKLSPVRWAICSRRSCGPTRICILPIGILLDRFSARNINAIGITLWSLAMAATAGVCELCQPDRRPHGHGRGRGDLDSVLRPHRARMDAGAGARRRQRVLERRQLRRSRARRGHHGVDCQRLGLARRLRRPRRARLCVACLQSVLVRPARKGELASADERKKILAERSAGSPDEVGTHGSPGVVLELLRSPSIGAR